MKEITSENLGTILKKVRKEKGLTQKDVAEGIHVDQSVISSWERGTGNPTFLNVYKLCQFFDMTIDELLGIERKKKPITLIITQDVIEKLFSVTQEFEEALAFIFPTQETKLHQKWEEMKQIHDLLFYSIDRSSH